MKKANLISLLKRVILLFLLTSVLLTCAACGGTDYTIALEGELAEGDTIEYTGGKVQFPMGHIADRKGNIVSYDVVYKVIDLANQSELTDEYAAFELKPGEYKIIYAYGKDDSLSKTISFSVVDTTAPVVEFMEIPNGLFLQDITDESINKLPLFSMEDASSAEGIDLKQTLKFMGEGDADFKEHPFRKINNSYEISAFGTFVYELVATDCYGNTTTATCQWKVKDRNWKPEKELPDRILADYSEEGYCNLVEGGDANQYYKIDNDYADSFLEEFEGAQGVLKIDMGFNNAAGYGNNTIRLRLPKTFTNEDLAGKYLAVRMYVEGEHLKDTFLFGGNNVEFRAEDSTTRAFTAGMTGLETGKWMTFYLEAATVENIGMYPNATYNPDTTFYEGGDPADAIQLCFHREAGFFNDMTLYIDSISIAEFLPDTTLTIDGNQASWTAVEGAVGYRIELNGEESVITETSVSLPGEKGYIRVTPMGDGVLTLDSQTVTGVYGLDAGDSIAKFDDPLYAELFNDRLDFSTDAEHNGYRPKSYVGTMTNEGLQMDIATGAWGVVSGIRFQFPEAQEKGSNTTLVLNMNVASSEYGQIRVYDYTGKQLGVIKLDESNTGKFREFEIDISAYKGKLEGIQLIFGPNGTFTSVNSGVSITFKDISLKNTYYAITVDGQSMMCAGTRKLIPGYTNKDVVQFVTFFNYNVSRDDTPLNFSGTVLLDGKQLQSSAVTVVGYPNTDTICFKVPHAGKVLTIMKGSVIYYGGIAVKVEETFNAKWNGSSWVAVAEIPAAPATEYVTLADGSVKTVQNKVELEPGYTANGVVQFLNVNDFGVSASDTPLGFEGTVMLDGEQVRSPLFVGYPSNTTIALKAPHQGCVLTILKDSVIYYGDSAVVVTKTFNAKWDGTKWVAVSEIPEIPETQYVTLADGTTRELMANVTLTPGFTMDSLVQFPDIYDFGAPADSTPIGFEGTVLLQGVEVEDPSFNGYLNSTTIGLEKLNHKGKVVTIMEGAIIYNDTAAVKVKSTFNAMWDGSSWTAVSEIPEPEEPQEGTLGLEYRYGTNNLLQVNTDLPASTPCANFLVTDNGCSIDQSANPYQQVGWIQMDNADGTIVLTFHFNSAFEAGQYYMLPAGAVFGFTDGSTYTLDNTYVFSWDGATWTVSDSIPTPEPEVTELSLQYYAGTNELIGVATNLPVTTPLANFLATDNGCSIDQSGNPYQQVGYIEMVNQSGTIGLLFHFNSAFEAGQYYMLPAGAVFGFTDGSTYTLDNTYVFTWDGSNWTVSDTVPTPEPEVTELTLQYYAGTNELIGVATNLPVTTPLANFLATDNGCSIDQSANPYQQVGYIEMVNQSGTIGLLFHFNSAFEAGQYYILPTGAVFGFTDGSTYTLDNTYVFSWDGATWTVSDSIPTPAPEVTELNFQYRYGTNNLIQVNTNLPATTPLANFTAGDNGCSIDQSANPYQQVGWIQMDNADGTIVLTFHFNSAFEAGQYYMLPAGAVFGFTDGSTYTLDNTYVFVWDGASWTAFDKVLSFEYRYGTSNLIQMNTNLPATTPLVNFTASDNGCSIDQSANPYQQVGWIQMDNAEDTIVLTFHFNSAFEAGQYYILPAGAIFGFTDGSIYLLDANYTFTWDGSNWAMTKN